MAYHTSLFSRSRLILSVCSLLLVSFLAACSSGSASTGTVATTPSGNTPATTQPTSVPIAHMKTFVGTGFTVSYPEGWKAIAKGRGQVLIVNQQAGQAGAFSIGINPAGGKVPAAEMIQFALIGFKVLPHYQKVDIASKATVGGDSWDQIAATGDVPVTGQTQLVSSESVVLADIHPATSPTARGFEIRYTTDASRFAQMNANTFQPMLQSFNFA